MYNYLILLLLLCHGDALAQQAVQSECTLTVSPIINQDDPVNKSIIRDLCQFLKLKNIDLSANQYWLSNDFSKYVYPYIDIFDIEQSKYGKDFYKPTLMELLPTNLTHQKIVKIAFIGHNERTKENQIKCIYNIIANVQNDETIFSKYLDFVTSTWQRIDTASLHYIVSPQRKKHDAVAIDRQLIDVGHLSRFFGIKPIDITYYSCMNAIELFRIKGFDYTHDMYLDEKGGLADYGDLVFSANNSEYYTHEVTHIYTNKICPQPNKYIDEGIAMCFGGSGAHDYDWHKGKLSIFLEANPGFSMIDYLDIYQRTYIENETPIPYVIAALVCQRTLRLYGKTTLIELLKLNGNIDVTLEKIGLSKLNFNEAIFKELQVKDFNLTNYY